ncbi:MAG: hypothetical protein LC750_00440 [Actinobacteria bacterium]|nr:hypothetical protein [Actinomycetota bacterium]
MPKKVWGKWTEDGQILFNDLFASMGNQGLYSHPKAVKQAREHWQATRWNAAWMAANIVSLEQKCSNHPANIATKTLAAVVLTQHGRRHKWTRGARRGYEQLVRQLGLKKAAVAPMTAAVLQFRDYERPYAKVESRAESAEVVILPVVRVERYIAETVKQGRKRRRLPIGGEP